MSPYCIHRDVCTSWKYYANERADTIFGNCPLCPYFKSKDDAPKFPTKYDDYEQYYDYEHDQYIIKRRH